MRNDIANKVIEIKIVKIKIDDGVNRNLTGIRLVSDLKRNLLYLDTLDMLGSTFNVEGGILKVRDSIVVMKGNRYNALYSLLGKTNKNPVDALYIFEMDHTKFWHLLLGHVSYKV